FQVVTPQDASAPRYRSSIQDAANRFHAAFGRRRHSGSKALQARSDKLLIGSVRETLQVDLNVEKRAPGRRLRQEAGSPRVARRVGVPDPRPPFGQPQDLDARGARVGNPNAASDAGTAG